MADETDDDLLAKFVKWVEDFEDETRTARANSEKDRDFYDGIQWTSDEIDRLTKRNQPVVTYNRIAPKINYIRGYEMKTRIDPRAFPRTPAHEDAAIAITDALRFVADTECFDERRSAVTENLLIEGYGGLIVEPEVVEYEETKKKVEIRLRKVPWDRIFYDPHSRESDFSDAKYVGIVRWWHLDEAQADPLYADKTDELAAAAAKPSSSDGEDNDTHGDRPHHEWTQTEPPRIKICQVIYQEAGEWMTAHFTKSDLLVKPSGVGLVDEDGKSYCPLILASAFVNRENERYGIVRSMISAQEEINKRRSKALHLLTFRQFIYEEGAVDQPNEAGEELAKPDGKVEVARGALSENRIQFTQTTDMLQGQMQLLQDAKVEIDAVGPEAPLVGEDRRVQSGRALQVRMQNGTMQLEPVFDSLRSWQKRVFHAIWYQIRQFKREEWWIRITDDNAKRGFRFVALNQPMTRSARMQELLKQEVPLQQAMDMLDLDPVVWNQLLQVAQQAAQAQIAQIQQAQQAQQAQMSQMAAQSGQPPQPQQQPQIEPKQIEAMVVQILSSLPPMQQEITKNDVGRLGCDVVIDASPDTTVLQQEEYAELVEMAQANPGAIPPTVIIQASQLRNKRELLAMMEKKPDPTQQQLQALQLQQLQAEIEKTKAQAADEMASAQQRMADMRSADADIPVKQAKAMEHAAKAGAQTMPFTGPPGGFRQ